MEKETDLTLGVHAVRWLLLEASCSSSRKDVSCPHMSPSDFTGSEMIFESSGRRIARIALSGELDLSVKERVLEMLQPSKDADDVIVDLSEVPYIDSTALGCLVHVKNDLIARGGGSVQLLGLRPNVRRVFALTKLDELFEIIE